MATPINTIIKPFDNFDATEVKRIFYKTSRPIYDKYGYQIDIYDNMTGAEVYHKYDTKHKELWVDIPKNTLKNGNTYYMILRCNGAEDSEPFAFNCYTTPVYAFTNMPSGTLGANHYTFKFNYNQKENISLDSYEGILSEIVYEQFPIDSMHTGIVYTNSNKVPYLGEFSFSNLQSGKTYELSFRGYTNAEGVITRVIGNFSVNYQLPKPTFNVGLRQDCSKGFIKIYPESITAVKGYDGIKIKRKIIGSNKWNDFKYYSLKNTELRDISYYDYTYMSGTEYEYTIVPMLNEIEGVYATRRITPKLNGVFISDPEESFKLYAEVQYSSNARNQQSGVFSPLGKQTPVVVSNGIVSYESGTVSGLVLNDDYEETRCIDRIAITKKKNAMKDFLTNKKPKLLRDYNGNAWLIQIVNNIPMNYMQGSAMGIPQIQFSWVQIGDPNNQQDLYDAGFVDEV